jgi:hypothetical protein
MFACLGMFLDKISIELVISIKYILPFSVSLNIIQPVEELQRVKMWKKEKFISFSFCVPVLARV